MKKKKWTPWSFLCFTGLPWFVIFTMAGIYIKKWYCSNYTKHPFRITGIADIKDILLYVALAWICIFARNCMWIGSSRRIGLFTWLDKWKPEPLDESARKKKAQWPDIPEDYQSPVPDQLPLGKQGKLFVQFNINSCLSILIFGSPGAGKTTLLLTMIIYQLYRVTKTGEPPPSLFVFDFKEGELYRKSCKPGDERVRFVSLAGRKYWGWDPYYRLSKDSTDDDVIRELTLIANVIIDGSNEKNAFFTDSAKVILIFVGLYDFRRGRSFLQTIDHITGGEVKAMLQKVMDGCEGKPEFKKVQDAIAEFVAIDDSNEALNNIKMTLKQKTSVFKVEDVRWALEYNPRKASPMDLEAGKSIFFYPGDTDVTDVVLKIIAKQLEYHCRHRDFMNLQGGGELRRIITVADECYTIGNVVDFAAWASVARAFRNTLIMIWQSYSQIKETYNQNIAESLMDDVAGVAVISVNSPVNADQFVSFAGEYLEEKKSYNDGGKNEGSYSRSYETKSILTKTDFLSLRREKEAIILADGYYFRVKSEPARYYMIPDLKKISDECLDAQRQAEGMTTKPKSIAIEEPEETDDDSSQGGNDL